MASEARIHPALSAIIIMKKLPETFGDGIQSSRDPQVPGSGFPIHIDIKEQRAGYFDSGERAFNTIIRPHSKRLHGPELEHAAGEFVGVISSYDVPTNPFYVALKQNRISPTPEEDAAIISNL
jgi:hypothetical protein